MRLHVSSTFASILFAASCQSTAPAPSPPPVPTASLGERPSAPGELLLRGIRDGLFWVGDGSYMAMFLVGPDGVAVVDAPPTLDAGFRDAIASVTDRPVTHLVYTHHHGDHIGGAGRFRQTDPGVQVIAHADTAAALARGGACTDCISVPDPRPAPDVTFADTHSIDLGGGQVLELAHHGANHTQGNLFVHAPNHATLMLVDVVYPGWVPFDLIAVSEDIPGYVSATDRALSYDFDTFVGGHVARPGTRAEVRAARDYLDDLKRAARRALSNNTRARMIPELVEETGTDNGWWLTARHTEAVTRQCAAELRARWTGRLAGVETYADDHCKRMQFSLRID